MTELVHEDVHQVFFGWSCERNSQTVLQHTFSNQKTATQWLRLLEPHIRLQPVGDRPPPASALSYLEFANGYGVILRRVHAGHSTGRNNAHALIAPASALGASVAMSLRRWPNWLDLTPDAHLAVLRTDDLVDRTGALEDFRSYAKHIENPLATALACFIEHPDKGLSIIGCPDGYEIPFVWGLRAAGDLFLRQKNMHRSWSFSTYEDRYDVSFKGLPDILFWPVKLLGVGGHRHSLVNLDQASPAQADSLAGQLVAASLNGTPFPTVSREVATIGTGSERPAPAHARAASHEAERRISSTERPDVSGPRHSSTSQQAAPVRKHPATELVRARNRDDFEVFLRGVEDEGRSLQRRAEARAILDVAGMDAVVKAIEDNADRDVKRLVRAVYGPKCEDLDDSNANEHATKIITEARSDRLARAVAATTFPVSKEKVATAGFTRWMTTGAARRSWRPRRSALVVMAVVAVALLAGLVGWGVLIGRPDTTRGDETVPAGASRPVAPPSTSARAAPLAGRAMFAQVDDSERVLAFVRVGERYLPRQPCVFVTPAWQCMGDVPPLDEAEGVTLVAIPVPADQVEELLRKAVHGELVGRSGDWGTEAPVM